MGEITAPIIAITLVLLSVFVPMRLHPRHHRPALPAVRGRRLGLDGDLGDQRAVAVAGPVLDPAHAQPQAAARAGRLDAGRHRQDDGRLRLDRPAPGPRRRSSAWPCWRASSLAHRRALQDDARRASCPTRTRARSSPIVQLPEGRLAEPHRGDGDAGRRDHPPRARRSRASLAVIGYDFINADRLVQQGLLHRPAEAVRGAARGRAQRRGADRAAAPRVRLCRHRLRRPLNLPPIIGLGTSGGFEYVLEALQGQPFSDVAAVLRGLVVSGQPAARADRRVHHLRRRHAAALPRHRPRARPQTLGVNISDIFNALQTTLGGYYVNDFNLFGRTWQVNVQAETPYRQRGRRHLQDPRPQQARARWCRCGRSRTCGSSSARSRSPATTTTAR